MLIIMNINNSTTNADGNYLNIDVNSVPSYLSKFKDQLTKKGNLPKGKNFYPANITNEELNTLDKNDLEKINSYVVRNNDSLEIKLTKEYFTKEFNFIESNLRKAATICTNKSLKKYLLAKADEINLGTDESIKKAEEAWLKNDSQIDFIMSPNLETYHDDFKGIRGESQISIYRTDLEMEKIKQQMLNLAPLWEATAPWKYHKTSSQLPQLKFVKVISFEGGSISFPKIVLAQSLPNDDVLAKKYGSRNIVYGNVSQQKNKSNVRDSIEKIFFTDEINKKFESNKEIIDLIGNATHEIGHATGGTHPDIKEPRKVFLENYSLLEEARAELFSLWVLPSMRNKNIITSDEKTIGYYDMLSSMLESSTFELNNHSGSRVMMLNYFIEDKVVYRKGEKFIIDENRIHNSVSTMMRTIADYRATGDTKSFDEFRNKYLKNNFYDEIVYKTKDMYAGIGLLTPQIEFDEKGNATGGLIYPNNIFEKKESLSNILELK